MLHKVITLANFKGGVGKSTSTAAIGACLAMKGYKVLLVDLDGQSNLTLYYVPNADIMEDSIFDTLVSGKAIPIINVKPNLDIVPSSLEMSSAEIAMTNTLAREQVLSRALSDVKVNYDFILIDCPPVKLFFIYVPACWSSFIPTQSLLCFYFLASTWQ